MLTKSFHGKPTFLVACVKKINFDANIRLFTRHFFCLFTQVKKISFFRETCYAHIERRDVRFIFLFRIFSLFKMFFQMVGAYAPKFRNEFPPSSEFIRTQPYLQTDKSNCDSVRRSFCLTCTSINDRIHPAKSNTNQIFLLHCWLKWVLDMS